MRFKLTQIDGAIFRQKRKAEQGIPCPCSNVEGLTFTSHAIMSYYELPSLNKILLTYILTGNIGF